MNKLDIIAQESEKAFLKEYERIEKLTGKAEKLMAAVGIIVGFQLLDIKRLTLSPTWRDMLYSFLTVSALVALGVALLFALLAMQVQQYSAHPRGEDLISQLRNEEISDQDAQFRVARMYLRARESNACVNDKRAKRIRQGGIMLIVGFLLAVASQVAARFV